MLPDRALRCALLDLAEYGRVYLLHPDDALQVSAAWGEPTCVLATAGHVVVARRLSLSSPGPKDVRSAGP